MAIGRTAYKRVTRCGRTANGASRRDRRRCVELAYSIGRRRRGTCSSIVWMCGGGQGIREGIENTNDTRTRRHPESTLGHTGEGSSAFRKTVRNILPIMRYVGTNRIYWLLEESITGVSGNRFTYLRIRFRFAGFWRYATAVRGACNYEWKPRDLLTASASVVFRKIKRGTGARFYGGFERENRVRKSSRTGETRPHPPDG